jgi:hypothetical protein
VKGIISEDGVWDFVTGYFKQVEILCRSLYPSAKGWIISYTIELLLIGRVVYGVSTRDSLDSIAFNKNIITILILYYVHDAWCKFTIQSTTKKASSIE